MKVFLRSGEIEPFVYSLERPLAGILEEDHHFDFLVHTFHFEHFRFEVELQIALKAVKNCLRYLNIEL